MRYAIYYAPERDTRLRHFGNRVLGRDAETGEAVAQIVPDGFQPDDWQIFTASPRRYGFHATLKAPFALKKGRDEAELLQAVKTFAATQAPVLGFNIAPVLDGRYVMLELTEPDARVQAFGDACVSAFEPFRAPLPESERARRSNPGLSMRQAEHLDRWGYPFVFEDFIFHLTLAGPLPEQRREDALAALKAAYEAAVTGEALAIRSVAVFAEPEAGAPFRLVLRAPLGGQAI
jgi:putative phosphonate metabolism protein